MPPSMVIFCPVMKLESGEQRKKVAFMMSWGFPTRPTGCCWWSGVGKWPAVVSIQPGAMELTRTLPARLTARLWVRAERAPLAAV